MAAKKKRSYREQARTTLAAAKDKLEPGQLDAPAGKHPNLAPPFAKKTSH